MGRRSLFQDMPPYFSKMKGKKDMRNETFVSDNARTDQIVRDGDSELVFSFGFLFVWFFST